MLKERKLRRSQEQPWWRSEQASDHQESGDQKDGNVVAVVRQQAGDREAFAGSSGILL